MPRAPRILIEGGLYHVYNRFARGEGIFAEPEESIEFLELLRDLKKRDRFQVFGWSFLSNHSIFTLPFEPQPCRFPGQ
jgi:hypothetical protein